MAVPLYRKARIYFVKRGDARYLSHLDLMRTMERAIRRADLPVKYTEGMNPHVKMSFPSALPLGMESVLEVMEIQLEPEPTLREVCERLAAELPPGLEPFDADFLYTGEKWTVRETHYRIEADADGLPTGDEVEDLFAAETVEVERKGKTLDLKKLVTHVEAGDRIDLSVAWTERGTVRPEDLLKALGRDPAHYRVQKTGMTFVSSLGETIRKTNDA